MTNGQLVSRIINSLRLLNKDEHISRRYVLSVAKNKANFLISQKLSDRSLFKEEDLFKIVECFRLKKNDLINCDIIEFKRCKSLMKSTKKLPDLLYSRYGSSIISVTTIDNETEFIPITLKQYSLQKNRMFTKYISQKYYYIRDGYLYIPDSEIEMVNIVLIPKSEEDVEDVSECKKCDKCKSGWDYNFICPDKLLEPVIQDTLKEILGSYKQIIPDENPNLTEHQRDKTII